MNFYFNLTKKYLRDTVGAIAIMFALMVPVVVGAAGMALDFSNAYLVQQRLAQALDAAALAGAATSSDEAEIRQKIMQFFAANYPSEKMGFTFDPVVVVQGDQVYVTGNAYYNTYFLSLIGFDTIDVNAKTVVQREVQGLEVALVLDNTGSMSSNNNITSLKRASTNFIKILFDHTSRPENIRIGLVPYSNSVNVGRYGLGRNPDGSVYGDGRPFVTLPSGVSFTNSRSSSTGWYGCVVEHNNSGYRSSATHVDGSYGQLWSYGSGWDGFAGHGWDANSSYNDPYDYDVLDEYEGPWDIYMFGELVSAYDSCNSSRCSSCPSSGTYKNRCTNYFCYCRNSQPNTGCPYARIVPLTSDEDYLLSQVDPNDYNVMYPDGNTLGNIGMAWGYRLLSPDPPFEEGHDWDNEHWKKAIVMMTDGDNTENGTYSSYWFTNRNRMNVTKFNDRFAETCQALKDKGVTIYTITFTSGINNTTKNYYRNCASSEDQYFDAPTQQELEDTFEQIARELSNLHIRE